jgi:hypothetical protein
MSRWDWRDGRNPYRSTAFQVLGLDVHVAGRAAIRAGIAARRQQVLEGHVLLFGVPVTEADLAEAARRVQDPTARLLDELCTHRPPDGPEAPTGEHLAELAAIVAELESGAPRDRVAPVTVNTTELARLIPPARPRTFIPLWTPEG